jgi:hypothetical protein
MVRLRYDAAGDDFAVLVQGDLAGYEDKAVRDSGLAERQPGARGSNTFYRQEDFLGRGRSRPRETIIYQKCSVVKENEVNMTFAGAMSFEIPRPTLRR